SAAGAAPLSHEVPGTNIAAPVCCSAWFGPAAHTVVAGLHSSYTLTVASTHRLLVEQRRHPLPPHHQRLVPRDSGSSYGLHGGSLRSNPLPLSNCERFC